MINSPIEYTNSNQCKMASPLKIFEKKSFLLQPHCVTINGTETQLKQLEFDFSRIAIISVHGENN